MSETNKFFSIDELTEMPPPRWMIQDMFEANSLVMVAGPPGSFKSFLVLDWLLCMASGRWWNQHKTEQAKVLYVLGEGRSSLLKRIQTWIHHFQPSEAQLQALKENFKVTFEVPQMAIKASVDNMLVGLQLENYQPSVIAIDTFARSFVGMDENSQRDVGLWVESADRLRSLGYTVIFLHHTAKNTEFGVKYRGSSAILGAMDTAMTMMRDSEIAGGVKLAVTKQKDHDEGEPLHFQRNIVIPPNLTEGSIVLVPIEKKKEAELESPEEAINQTVEQLLDDDRFPSIRQKAAQLEIKFKISETAAYSKIQRASAKRLPKAQPAAMIQ